MKRVLATVAAVATLSLAAGCGSSGDDNPAGSGSGSGASASASSGGVSGTVTVFAAASLTESFNDLQASLKTSDPDLTVTYNFGGSGALATQIQQGPPADVI
ncbi:MAG TPA: substrate-binding domain-containing protein, partial [Mycobacteriales bacterium]|nr:substrate-binding domain-containing protein [Mycobacteriales bacterium]